MVLVVLAQTMSALKKIFTTEDTESTEGKRVKGELLLSSEVKTDCL